MYVDTLGSGSSGPWCYKHSNYCDSATLSGSCRLAACIKQQKQFFGSETSTFEEEDAAVGMNDAMEDLHTIDIAKLEQELKNKLRRKEEKTGKEILRKEAFMKGYEDAIYDAIDVIRGG